MYIIIAALKSIIKTGGFDKNVASFLASRQFQVFVALLKTPLHTNELPTYPSSCLHLYDQIIPARKMHNGHALQIGCR